MNTLGSVFQGFQGQVMSNMGWKIATEIVDLPMENSMVIFQFVMYTFTRGYLWGKLMMNIPKTPAFLG